jgi:hypothetical protein
VQMHTEPAKQERQHWLALASHIQYYKQQGLRCAMMNASQPSPAPAQPHVPRCDESSSMQRVQHNTCRRDKAVLTEQQMHSQDQRKPQASPSLPAQLLTHHRGNSGLTTCMCVPNTPCHQGVQRGQHNRSKQHSLACCLQPHRYACAGGTKAAAATACCHMPAALTASHATCADRNCAERPPTDATDAPSSPQMIRNP